MEHLDDGVQVSILKILAVLYPQFQSRPSLKKQLDIPAEKYRANIQFLRDLGYVVFEVKNRDGDVYEGVPTIRITAQGITHLRSL